MFLSDSRCHAILNERLRRIGRYVPICTFDALPPPRLTLSLGGEREHLLYVLHIPPYLSIYTPFMLYTYSSILYNIPYILHTVHTSYIYTLYTLYTYGACTHATKCTHELWILPRYLDLYEMIGLD